MNHSWASSGFSVTLQLAFVYSYKHNVISVTGMGNISNNQPKIFYPANFQDLVISVGATNAYDERPTYSNYGTYIKVSAPGGTEITNLCPNHLASTNILSCWSSADPYEFVYGTSMATPLVSGLASLLKGKNSSLTNEDIKNIIYLTADDKGQPGWDQYLGYGRINCRRALEWTSSPYTFTHSTTSGSGKTVTSEGWSDFVPYGISGLIDGRVYFGCRYKVNAHVTLPSGINHVWGRSNEPNIGYNNYPSPQHGIGYTKASFGYNSAALETYVYDVRLKIGGWIGPFIGMFPCEGNNVQFAYTTHRINRIYPYRNENVEDRQQVGGCPWLFVHSIADSSWYVGDNNILHRSEIPENSGLDLTDIYKLNVIPNLTAENEFSIKLIETENDYGYIDKVNFKAIDHPAGSSIGITENNQIVTYNVNNRSSSEDADLNTENNITKYIRYEYSGSQSIRGDGSDSINVSDFDAGGPPTGDSLALIFEVSNNRLAAVDEEIKDYAGEVSMYLNSSPNPNTKKFSRRENSSVIIIPISDISTTTVDSAIITWYRDYDLKYLFIAPVSYTGFTTVTIPLISAIHTVEDDVLFKLSTIDGNYANIDSISMITLNYSNITPPVSGYTRDYIFEVTGRYENTGNSTSPMARIRDNNSIPIENKLYNNYPNPFNPKTSIKFSIKSDRWVKIIIYDILGRVVNTLVNEFKQKGSYNVDFNGTNYASGVYFYRIEAGDYVNAKKMVLVK
jgi:hypothetical protein